MAQICPVAGAVATSLPPEHPEINVNDPEARCPITNAKVSHHSNAIHSHPSSPTIPDDKNKAMDASQCPALQNVNSKDSITDATCPVVGPVSAVLPPSHPRLTEEEAGKICPVTNATLSHHKDKVAVHPPVPKGEGADDCPVAGQPRP